MKHVIKTTPMRGPRLQHTLQRLLAILLLLALGISELQSQTTWSYTAAANLTWETAGSWSPASVPDSPGASVTINANAAGTRTININAPHTVYSLAAGRGGANNTRMYIFQGAGVLTLGTTNGIRPLVGQNSAFGYQEYPVVFAGTNGVRFGGGAAMVVGGNNTFSGDVEFNRNTTRIASINALPRGSRLGNITFTNVGGGYGTMDLGGLSLTINGLDSPGAGAGTITTSSGNPTLTIGDNNQGGTFGGVINNGSGTVGITKIGSGTLTLNGANLYNGATTVNGGVLQLSGTGDYTGSSSFNVGGGGTLDISGLATLPLNMNALGGTGNGTGNIIGNAVLNSFGTVTLSYVAGVPALNAAGALVMTNAQPITINIAAAPLSDGTYKLISKSGGGAVDAALGTVTLGGVGIVGGGTPYLELVGGELYLSITNGASVVEWGSGNGTWAHNVTGWNAGGSTVFTNGNAALLSDRFSTGNPTLTLNTEVLPQSVFVLSTNHYTISGSGSIGVLANLRKLGTGALTLDAANTYTGGSTLFEGILNFKNAAALGDASGAFTINGGTIDNTSGSPLTLLNYPQVWGANINFVGSSDLNLGAGVVTLTAGRTITVSSTNKLTVGGDISASGFGFAKSGPGILQLDGNNNWTASSTMNQGEVIIGNDGALNGAAGLSLNFVTDFNYKALSLNGHTITIRSLLMGALGGNGYTNTIIRNNHPSTPATLTVNPNASATYAGTITDGGAAPLSLIKDGTQNLQLGSGGVGAMTYSGDTTVNAGTLSAGANDIFPHGVGRGNISIGTGATLDTTDRGQMTFNGLNGGGTLTHSANSTANILRVGESGADGDFAGVIQNGAAVTPFVSFTKLGAGRQILSGANTYTGPTTNATGTLQIGNGSTAGSLVSASLVNNASLIFNRDGVMTYAGVISGTGTLTNAGLGIVNLTGVSTYTGATVVDAGTLRVNGAGTLPATTTVTVNSGGAIGGTGKILGPVNVLAGGGVAPGASIGALTISNNLTLGAASTNVFEINLNNMTCDSVIGLSNVTYNGTLALVNIGGTDAATNNATLKLFDAQSYTGVFSVLNSLPALPNRAWDLSNLAVNGTIRLVYIGATTPTNLTLNLTGNELNIAWPESHAGWRLQAQTNSLSVGISNNWFMVSGSLATNHLVMPFNLNNETVFYRLVYP